MGDGYHAKHLSYTEWYWNSWWQRVHGCMVEELIPISCMLMIGALYRPITTFAICGVYLMGIVVYSIAPF